MCNKDYDDVIRVILEINETSVGKDILRQDYNPI